jgi:hypothetical protein
VTVLAVLFAYFPYLVSVYAAMFQSAGASQSHSKPIASMKIGITGKCRVAAYLQSTGHYLVWVVSEDEGRRLLKKCMLHALIKLPPDFDNTLAKHSGSNIELVFDTGYSDAPALNEQLMGDLLSFVKSVQDERLRQLGVKSAFDNAIFTLQDTVLVAVGAMTPRIRAPLISCMFLLVAILSGMTGQAVLALSTGETLLVAPVKRMSLLLAVLLSSTLFICSILLVAVPLALLVFLWNPLPGVPPIVVAAPLPSLVAAWLITFPLALLFGASSICIALFRQANSMRLLLLQSIVAQILILGIWNAPKSAPIFAALIPLSNLAGSISSVLAGDFNWSFILLSCLVSVLYSIPLLYLSEKFIQSESIFSSPENSL